MCKNSKNVILPICVWCHSDMRSTGLSIEPCSSWTARWRQTRCCATKHSRTGSRGTGKGGRWRRPPTRLPGPRQQGWTQMSCTTRCAAPSAPPRWPCLTKRRFTTSSTSWPATAETQKRVENWHPPDHQSGTEDGWAQILRGAHSFLIHVKYSLFWPF